ncbi:MAG TPA: exodeoxyribonuclease VII small subunit [Ignavibacteriaceae bacterium]|nr:exodeoxyribonuclease VII small subunit [Ignavibacteriaceae bacterium]
MSQKKNNISNQGFEANLARLEEISSMLEGDGIGLENALTLYEEGIELSKKCITVLKSAELKITELKKQLDTLTSKQNELFEE